MANPQMVVIGIDGACWDYFQPLLDKNRLPNLQKLIHNGVHGILESTLPAITPMAWSSFITGKNAGKHGLFDFQVKVGDKLIPFSSTHRYGTSFWKTLNKSGFRTGIINIPATYPPEEVDGFMIAGFGAPEGSRQLTYPPDLLDTLERSYGPYQVVIPHQITQTRGLDGYLAATLENEQKQTTIALDLAGKYEPDLLVINFQSADQFNHYVDDPAYIDETIIGIDQNIGRLIRRFPDAGFIVLSDHGSRRVEHTFLLRNWLLMQGFSHYLPRNITGLTALEINHMLAKLFKDHWQLPGIGEKLLRKFLVSLYRLLPATGKQQFFNIVANISPYSSFLYQYQDRIDWAKAQVYEMSEYGCFYIHLPEGRQNPTEYESLRQRFIEAISSVKTPNGDPLARQVYTKENLYNGPMMDLAPDVVIDYYRSGCGLKGGGFGENIKKTRLFTQPASNFGSHIQEGLFVFSGGLFKTAAQPVPPASIMDIPATILHLFAVPIPEDYDGRVLDEHICNEFMAAHPVQYQQGDGEITPTTEIPFSDEELKELEDKLRDLGYIG